MVKKYQIIILIFCLVVGVFFYVKKIPDKNFEGQTESEWGDPAVSLKEAEKSAISIPETGETYKDQFLGISFKYPKNLSVSNLGQNEGEYVLLVQDPIKNIGIQILAMEFADAFNTLTKERIESDLEIKLEKYAVIKIGKKQDVEAVTFLTGEDVKYREVWFVKNQNLIQVKAYQSSEPLIIAILQTVEI